MNAPFSPAEIDLAISRISPFAGHYAELLRWARSGAIALIVPQRDAAWPKRDLEAVRKPVLVLVADDDELGTGPAGWRCAKALSRWPRAAIVHASAAMPGQYEAFGAVAALTGRFVLIETSSRHAEAWAAGFGRHHVPAIRILPREGAHPLPRQPEQMH